MLRRLKNVNGVIMVYVLGAVIISMVIFVGVLNFATNKALIGQSVIEAIRTEQLALGAFYQDYDQRYYGLPSSIGGPKTISTQIEQKEFSITVTPQAGIGPNNTQLIDISVTY